jgi:hypothetical protein
MHTYIGNKKNIAGSGLLLIELEKVHQLFFWQQRNRNWKTTLGKIKEKRD